MRMYATKTLGDAPTSRAPGGRQDLHDGQDERAARTQQHLA